MVTDDRLRASEWLQIAETELDRAQRFLDQNDLFAAYCLDQAVQAYLYAYLLSLDRPLEVDREYDLEELLERASKEHTTVRAHADVARSIEALSLHARHPGRQLAGADATQTLRAISSAYRGVIPLINHVRSSIRGEDE